MSGSLFQVLQFGNFTLSMTPGGVVAVILIALAFSAARR